MLVASERGFATGSSYLQTCPLWDVSEFEGIGGRSIIPSDGADSGAEGAGLMGCEARPSVTEGLLAACLDTKGLGDLAYGLPSSGGGERAICLGLSAFEDMGREGKAVRTTDASSPPGHMASELGRLIVAILTTFSHSLFLSLSPTVTEGLMIDGQLLAGDDEIFADPRGLATGVPTGVPTYSAKLTRLELFLGRSRKSCETESLCQVDTDGCSIAPGLQHKDESSVNSAYGLVGLGKGCPR